MKQRRTSISKSEETRIRSGKAFMTIGCLGSLLSFGLCASGPMAGSLWGEIFVVVAMIGVAGLVTYITVPNDAMRYYRARKLVRRRQGSVLLAIERHGGTIDIKDLLRTLRISSHDLNIVLEALADQGRVTRRVDPDGLQWIAIVSAEPAGENSTAKDQS